MAKLYLIRHAQSENNVIWDGRGDHQPGRKVDPEITAAGYRQAEVLSAHLTHPESEPRQHPFQAKTESHFGLTHVYCSLMTRSILTAKHITDASGLPLQAMPDIFEKHGIYDLDEQGNMHDVPGPDRGYFNQRFPDLGLPDDFNDSGWWSRPVEDDARFLQRMKKLVEKIAVDDHVAMVVHGDFLDQFVNELMGVVRHQPNYDSHWVGNWTFHNTSISRIDFLQDAASVIYLNRTDHLPNELITW